jgi:hypothetical protein
MANLDYTQEDKVREIGPGDFARILILSLGSTDAAGIKLLGEKSDISMENIKSDDSGSLRIAR